MRNNLISLLQQTNNTINRAINNSNYVLVTYSTIGDLNPMAMIADAIRKHGGEIVVLITYTLSLMDNICKQTELFEQTKDEKIATSVLESKRELFDEPRYSQYEFADTFHTAVNEYVIFLRRLFNSDNLLKYKE